RYIEVVKTSFKRMAHAEKFNGGEPSLGPNDGDARGFFVECRGLPFSAEENEVFDFLGGQGIKRVVFKKRSTAEAIIECEDEESFKAALSKNRRNLGKRWIEVREYKP
ncbi:hypothetical protein PMAYCL1PPCAC_32350, partial [Pristionchus mayeri]